MQTVDETTASSAGAYPAIGEDAAEILENDHVTIKALLNALSAGQETTERTLVLEKLKALLTVHNAMEETLVYPALAVSAHKKWESERLYHETAMADMMVFQLDTMLKQRNETGFEPLAKTLQTAILEHIDDEEQKALPHLRERTEAAEQVLLTSNMRQFRGAIRVKTVV